MEPSMVGLFAVLGLALGRLGSPIVRAVPEERPDLRAASVCESCGEPRTALAWVPLIGPLLVPCGGCGLGMGRWEVILDITMAACFALMAARFEAVVVLSAYLAFTFCLVVLSAIDLRTLRLPDRLTFPTFLLGIPLLGVAGSVEGRGPMLVPALVGAFSYFGILLLTHLVYPRGMGFGDVKLALSMGLFVGWIRTGSLDAFSLVLYAMLIGFVIGTVAGIGVMAVRGRSTPYPFGPFLVSGAFLAIWLSDSIGRGA